ncbi:MAG TPA: hypothetical protein VFY68_06325 [Nitrososphaeraceae archaeon]|nr:hypothetical protein [Nitrososphaeraceae archaeon]
MPICTTVNDLAAADNAPLLMVRPKKRGVVTAKFENIEFKAIEQICSRCLTIQEILKNLLTVIIY